MPEIRHHCPNIPFLLVGVKNVCDYDKIGARHGDEKLGDATAFGKKLARHLGAVKYMECDVSTREGVNEVFAEVSLTPSESPDACQPFRLLPQHYGLRSNRKRKDRDCLGCLHSYQQLRSLPVNEAVSIA